MNGVKYLFLIFFGGTLFIAAQNKELTFKQAYLRGTPELIKPLRAIETWDDENSYLTTKEEKIIIVTLPAKTESVLIDFKKENENLPAKFNLLGTVTYTKDYSKFILQEDNDLYFYDRSDSLFAQLTNDEAVEKNPIFSPNGKLIAYTKDKNLFWLDLTTGKEVQLTFDGSDTIYNGYASWVYYEEILGRSSHYRAFYWSPASKQIAFMRFDDSKVPTFTLCNADGVHGKLEIAHYPKPGDPIPEVKLGIVNLGTNKITWVDSTVNKENYIAWVKFTSDGKDLFYQRMNRGQDRLELVITDVKNPNPKVIYTEKQKTWVEFIEDIYPLKNDGGIIFRSEVDGWYHLYHYNLDGKLINKITSGNWSVNDIALIDEERKIIYFHAGKKNSTEKHLYKISFNGTGLTKLTEGSGTHNCTLLKGENFFLDKFSSITNPPKLFLYNLLQNKKEVIADSKLPELDKYNLGKVELFRIPTEDGYNLPAKWFLPPDFKESKKYPVIVSIYGGPGVAIVKNKFPRRGLANYFLAQNGIIVLQIDNRGSGHFGKKGKDELHRKLGSWEIDDLITAVKWLREKPFVDSAKIAITGGSYGGYVTSMALARAGEYFKYGIAKYAVTDWRLYDNIYTERYMDLPSENPEGYEYSSVMVHAENYKGGMLITHGTMDDNVHVQNTLQLIDKLEDLDKDFELMFYPNQRHGIRYPKSPHSMKLDIKFWFKNLLGREFR